MQIHGHEVDVQNGDHESIKEIVRGWQDHETDFSEMRHAVDNAEGQKIHIGNDVFEKRDGAYILRKSSESY